jgi:hypothetical protein
MDDMGYNSGGHQQHVLKITRGEYSVQSTHKLGLLMLKCCVKEKSFLIMQAYMYNNSVICVIK